jgi:hypothetical protein
MSWRPCGTNRAPGPCLIKIEGGRACPDLALFDGAGEGNRTLMTSLEDRWPGCAREQRKRTPCVHAHEYP